MTAPGDLPYLVHLGAAAEALRSGNADAAMLSCRHAIAVDPRRPEAWAALAQCEIAALQPVAALASWDAAIARAPRSAEFKCGKAAACRSLAQPEAAAALYDAALALDPRCTAALLGRIALDLDGGRLEAASALLARVPAAERGRADVHWTAARLALARSDFAAARTEAAALAATPGMTDVQRGEALLLLGEALGELGDATGAFAAAAAGKACLHQHHAPLAASRESEVARSRRLAAWWRAAPPAAWAPAPATGAALPGAAAAHVFLVGFPRSGTTLLEQVLAGHRDIVALEEAPTLADAYAALLADDAACGRLAALDAAAADRWRARYWATVAAHGIVALGKTFVDKAPASTSHLPLIARLFPDARILFAVRDPRDVVLSCFRTAFQMNAMTYSFTTLAGTAACYDAVMTMAAAYRRDLPLPLTEVRHEALVADPAGEVARIAAFIGLPDDHSMAAVALTAANRDVRTPSARQVRAGINRRGVGRWRAYAASLAPVLPTLDRWVAAFGYEPA